MQWKIIHVVLQDANKKRNLEIRITYFNNIPSIGIEGGGAMRAHDSPPTHTHTQTHTFQLYVLPRLHVHWIRSIAISADSKFRSLLIKTNFWYGHAATLVNTNYTLTVSFSLMLPNGIWASHQLAATNTHSLWSLALPLSHYTCACNKSQPCMPKRKRSLGACHRPCTCCIPCWC